MIHHLSVAARDPQKVSAFLAEIMNGVSIDFAPNPGSYMAIAPDGHGTGVEVYPAVQPAGARTATPARPSCNTPAATAKAPPTSALSVERGQDEIRAAAAARGWPCYVCDRGGHFHVMEVWVENDWLIEVLPPAFAAEYLTFAGLLTAGGDAVELMKTHFQLQASPLTLAGPPWGAPRPLAAPAVRGRRSPGLPAPGARS